MLSRAKNQSRVSVRAKVIQWGNIMYVQAAILGLGGGLLRNSRPSIFIGGDRPSPPLEIYAPEPTDNLKY